MATLSLICCGNNLIAGPWGGGSKVRNEKYPVDGPAGAGAGHALGAGGAWLWSCGGAGRLVVRRYLWRGLRTDNYRSDTTFAVRSWARRSRPALCLICALEE